MTPTIASGVVSGTARMESGTNPVCSEKALPNRG